jgi:hypothetical protein
LRTDPDSSHWYYVLTYLAQNEFSVELARIAREWTQTQSKSRDNWEDVMITLLKSPHALKEDRDLAEQVTQYYDHYDSNKQFRKLINYLEYDLGL